MAKVWFSIGSNINREKNVKFAISHLKKKYGPVTFSPVYETKAVGFIGNDFYNLVGSFTTELSIHQLRDQFDRFEQQTGRIKTGHHFEDRTLDLDILFYDEIQYQDDRITIPHPDVVEYDFILLPLSELSPDFTHPILGETLKTLRLNLFVGRKLKVVEFGSPNIS